MPVPSPIVARELVPDRAPAVPDGFTLVDEALLDGLPRRIQLGDDHVGVLVVPTGLAAEWRGAAPAAAVSASDAELLPPGPGDAAVTRVPARLLVLRGDDVAGSLPLVAGRRYLVGDDGGAGGARLEVVVLAWDIRAGTLRGPGDTGARVRLAWRRADRAPGAFPAPPVHPRVRAREPEFGADDPTGGPA
jgi:hypothetical protein